MRDIGSKSEAEIEAYLDALEYGARRVARRDRHEGRWRDRSDRWNRAHRWVEGTAPAARQVSGSWIETEDGLASEITRRVDEEEQSVAKKFKEERRKCQRSQARKQAVSGADDVGRSSHQVRRDDLEGMRRTWTAEDWDERLGPEEMKALNEHLRTPVSSSSLVQAKAEGKLRGLSQHTGPFLSETASTIHPTAPKEQMNGSASKYDKIARDEAALERLSKLPKRARTNDDKSEYKAILNRRRNRHVYRRKKLFAEGLTEEDIQDQGGVDAIMAQRAGVEVTPALPVINGSTDGVSQSTCAVDMQDRSPLPKTRKTCTTGSHRLHDSGVIDYLSEKGWEIFNFDTLLIHST